MTHALHQLVTEEEPKKNGLVVAGTSDTTKRDEPSETIRKANEWNEEIIQMLVHDLRNPLSSIKMLSDLAQKRIQEGSTSVALHFLTLIDVVEEDASQLIEILLGLLELSDGKFALTRKPVDVGELIQRRVAHIAATADKYAISLTAELPGEAVHILADSRILTQVIDNLLTNALKFTPAQGWVTVRLSCQIDHITFSVQDSGIGIAPNKLPALFEKFTDARRLGIRGEKTSGLGLSVVKKIVDLHKGRIYVASQPQQGSTFTVELPV